VLEVDPDREDSCHSGRHRLLHHVIGIAELLEVAVGVYEDAAGSS